MHDEGRSGVERLLREDHDSGRQLSSAARRRARTVEDYLRAGNRPRWMERLSDVDRGIAAERRRVAAAYAALREEDPPDFAERWRAVAARWVFDSALNELIREHNDWYPIERDLAMDLRTRDYVLVNGRSYRRPVLDAVWLLREFPA